MMMMTLRQLLALTTLGVSILVMASCDGRTPTAPAPTPTPPPTPNAPAVVTGTISGFVLDLAYRGIAGANVDISDQTGHLAWLTTATSGRYEHAGIFTGNVILRAVKDGYVTSDPVIVVPRAQPQPFGVTFWLESLQPAVSIEPGDYTLTFSALNDCPGLPEDLRGRVFPANVKKVVGANQYNVEIPELRYWLGGPGWFSIGVVGNYVAATDDTNTSILELPGLRFLELSVGGEFVASTAELSMLTFGGFALYCEMTQKNGRFCQSAPTESVTKQVRCPYGTATLTKR